MLEGANIGLLLLTQIARSSKRQLLQNTSWISIFDCRKSPTLAVFKIYKRGPMDGDVHVQDATGRRPIVVTDSNTKVTFKFTHGPFVTVAHSSL